MTLSEHLEELRRRVGRSVAAVVLGTIIAFVFNSDIWRAALVPYLEAGGKGGLRADSPLDGFVQPLKLSFIVAIVAMSPYVLWQMWGFIAAGLYDHERRAVRVFFPLSISLFAAGLATAFLVVLPIGMRFLIQAGASHSISDTFSVNAYLSLCLSLVFGMGLAFQLPLVMLFLQAVGIVARESLRKRWRVAVLVAFVVAMILTPDPSPVSQILMAAPLVALWFMGVWGGRFVGESREPFTVLKAWPLLILVALFLALFAYRRDLRDLASKINGQPACDAPADAAPAPK
jgi:sec-independent protein translocase protein TatC